MSHLASPSNRNSIFGWVKNLRRGAFLSNESVNDISDNDVMSADSKSPPRSSFSGSNTLHPNMPHSPQHHHITTSHSGSQPIPFPSMESNTNSPTNHHHLHHHHHHHSPTLDFLRPLLQHKLRSTNNVNRVRSNSNTTNQNASASNASQHLANPNADLRQHRDSFLQNNPLVDENSKYFGVPLPDAISQASAKISILGSTPSSKSSSDDVLHYGRIPIVVAKCGVYLKKNGLSVEGIFRVGGASKRIKELQLIFNSPPEFGKKLSWDGYTVHDAASVLRRYLNALPEPLVPLDLYQSFREPLKSRPRVIKYMKYKAKGPLKVLKTPTTEEPQSATSAAASAAPGSAATDVYSEFAPPSTPADFLDSADSKEDLRSSQTPSSARAGTKSPSDDPETKAQRKARNYKKLTRDIYEAIDEYKELLDEVPNLLKQLLFYILDLLAMVQGNSSENLMLSRNLAAIFQPCILSHPDHDLDPEEYDLSQLVVEFLIQYAYKLLPNNEQSSPPRTASVERAPSSGLVSRTTGSTGGGGGARGGADGESRPQSGGSTLAKSRNSDGAKNTGLAGNTRASGRQHSQSLSSPHPDDMDLIGFRSLTKPERGMTLSDTDNDFASASSDDEYAYDGQNDSAKASGTPNLLYIVNGNDKNAVHRDGVSADGSPSGSPPIIVSQAHDA